ncbi:glycosyltransferase family 2 protein [Saccharicrinis fermentans]|uniref:Chondroitin polymerase n=1 Tax=Saccharicrinis fermentans DSM 9555 = JCM 21142 TaxID=869213 RepID=W7YK72_9BACT|nr:glycosyltransferase family 2 protein [Saccharicrinis fermentans]GAF04936.1 chondroitin polymerase [Saccharicrinis fermentans DSM 9555 = JCM 21142]
MKISIITPSYNQGQFIEETILSVLNQKYHNLEFIIIDGGSTDQTVEIIKKYQDKITYWVSEEDNGQTHAINKGFQKATGEIITWINSDDLLIPDSLNKINAHFKNDENLKCLFGQWIEFDEQGDRPLRIFKQPTLCEWLYTSPYAQPSTYYKRSLLKDIGYLNEELHFSMDNDFFKRIILSNVKYKYVDEFYSKFRWHSTSKSSNLMELCRQNDKLIYITILESYKSSISQKLITFIKEIGLYQQPTTTYQINIQINNDDLIVSFIHYISFYIGRWYNEGNYNKVAKSFFFIKEIGALPLMKKLPLNTIFIRHKYVPHSLINLVRKFTR